jgi:AhpD family alkylhydroperoxidase
MHFRSIGLAALGLVAMLTIAPATAQDAYQAAIDDVKATFGMVPGFIAKFPKVALPGAWAEMKALLLSPDTALDPKTKALIAVGVAAAIKCESCLWMDTNEALRTGATEDELQEAIGIAALEQHWSTVISGLQIDVATIKAELGGEAAE